MAERAHMSARSILLAPSGRDSPFRRPPTDCERKLPISLCNRRAGRPSATHNLRAPARADSAAFLCGRAAAAGNSDPGRSRESSAPIMCIRRGTRRRRAPVPPRSGWITSRTGAVQRSSASRLKIRSHVQASTARLRQSPKPLNRNLSRPRPGAEVAISAVSSVLPGIPRRRFRQPEARSRQRPRSLPPRCKR